MWTVFSFLGSLGSSGLHKKITPGHEVNAFMNGVLISTIQYLMRSCKFVQFVNTYTYIYIYEFLAAVSKQDRLTSVSCRRKP